MKRRHASAGVCAALLLTSSVAYAQQTVSGQVFNLPENYTVTIRLQAPRAPNFYETKTRPDGNWTVRSVASNNYTVSVIRPQGSTLGICFQPASQTISVENRDISAINFRAQWPMEVCPSGVGARSASGFVLGLQAGDVATVVAQSAIKGYKAVVGGRGAWEIMNMEPGVYNVTVQTSVPYTFIPPSASVDLTVRSATNVSFRAAPLPKK